MNSKKPKSGLSIVEIHWHDASYSNRTMNLDEVNHDGSCKLIDCGYLISEDKTEIHIGAEYSPNDNTWRHVIHIPKAVVTRRRRVK